MAAGWVWFLTVEGREKADQWSSSAAFGLAALTGAVALLVWLWRHGVPAPDANDLVVAALEGLVRAQSEQWTAEQAARRVADPYPLPVHWRVSARAERMMASWASVRGRPGDKPVSMDGNFEQIAAVFTHPQSPRRLVVLGEPGAGKSMLVLRLALDLLTLTQKQIAQDQEPDWMAPVLLPIGGWNPQQPLPEWIAERLAADYPALRRPVTGLGGRQRSLAAELVARGRILPILDGLDEITGAQHPAALAAVQTMAGRIPQFVLTCRTQAYEDAVDIHGSLLGIPVVEIQPLNTRQAGHYLIDGTDDGRARWATVTDQLYTEPRSPVATVLTTPLYTWLARIAYRHRNTDPSQLLNVSDDTHPPENLQASIEHHLLDQLIPTAFLTATGGHPARTAEQATAAHRHLTYLATHLHHQDTYDLAWWKLHRALPNWQLRLMSGLAVGLTSGLIGGLAFALDGGHTARAWFGFRDGFEGAWVVGLSAAIVGGFFSTTDLRRIEFNPRKLMGRLGLGLVIGLLAWAAIGHPAALLIGLLFMPAGGWYLSAADSEQRAITPTAVLNEDRAATLMSTFTLGSLLGSGVGIMIGNLAGTAVAVLFGTVLGLVAALGFGPAHMWGQFLLVRALLAIQGRAPLRLMGFLQEAYDRGVLRQAGGVYQFRHAQLQDHLALAQSS